MGFKGKMRDDGSGISTLLIAAVIVVVVVVAAGAAYVVLSGDDDKKEELAPGTTLLLDISFNGTEMGLFEQTILGQNKDEYFYMLKGVGTLPLTQYGLSPKDIPKDAEITGTEPVDTFEGLKTLTVLEYTTEISLVGSAHVKSYFDPETGVTYKSTVTYADPASLTGAMITEVQILKDYDIILQESYKQSKSIGKTYEYVYDMGIVQIPAKIECVADCLDGQYGVAYDLSSLAAGLKAYYLSNNIQGLPTDAVNTGNTLALNTIDGNITTEIWTLAAEGFTFYFEPDTHIVYRFVLSDGTLSLIFDLTKKP